MIKSFKISFFLSLVFALVMIGACDSCDSDSNASYSYTFHKNPDDRFNYNSEQFWSRAPARDFANSMNQQYLQDQLLDAVRQDRVQGAAEAIARGAKPDWEYVTGNEKITLLMVVLLQKNLKMIELLLSKGANVHRKYKNLYPMHLAAELGDVKIGEILIRYGADVNCAGDEGVTPLMLGIGKSNLQFVEFLLNHDADPSKPAILKGNRITPIDIAADLEDRDISTKILEMLSKRIDAGRNNWQQENIPVDEVARCVGVYTELDSSIRKLWTNNKHLYLEQKRLSEDLKKAIKKKFHRIAQTMHPDICKEKETNRKYFEYSQCWEKISNAD